MKEKKEEYQQLKDRLAIYNISYTEFNKVVD